MKRLKLLAAVAVLGVFACEEATPPPPVGSIVGQVAIEGTGIDGVTVNLSNGNSTTTSGGGSYRFDSVEGGAYTVTISGYPSDATFDATSAAATISSAGQSVTVNFTGAYIRTSSVMGSVTVENQGLRGVTVSLSGVSSATAVTDDSGQYAFTGLRMGSYSVEISGFDSNEVGFASTASAVSVGVGESQIVSFDGTYLRTAGIQGRVSVEGEGLAGVTVSLSGGPDAVSETATTDAGGQYSFAKLRAGDYSVAISGYNTKDYEFEVTSQTVTVALGETANAPFEGVLLRTSGISGRVFVAGVGHAGVTVTLSGGDLEADMTTETDDAGVYAFAGLAAGTYTVAISGFDAEAYVFDTTEAEVTVGDDESAIQNFEGSHATTASISGTLFVDEAAKNDAMDEGEAPFAAAGVPVTLVGPGVHDINTALTNEMGQFTFAELRSGTYQVVVQIPDAVAALMPDYAYGGPSEGYAVVLAVGQAATQNIPMDITHQTVNFSVTLRSGETTGDALPGAMVTLYSDLEGEYKITDGTTDDDGMAAIRFARSEVTGSNTVYASVMAEGYHAAGGMQDVTWDPQLPASMASNEGDILNLTADVTFTGATITTDQGGGDPLDGWAVNVMMGEGDDAAAVEGDDVPEELDDAGMAAFMRTVEADDLPVTYTFSVAASQGKGADGKPLDGGESYESDTLTYEHDGLSVAGTDDAGTIEVRYTTQTIMVYVHHEKDQVKGYTGNILGEDVRDGSMVQVSIRHVDAGGRHMQFDPEDWTDKAKSTRHAMGPGVLKFTGVPADADVVVKAGKMHDTLDIIVLGSNPAYGHNDEIHAYRDFEDNGVEGGAFGAQGGYSHTVSLCPLKDIEPTGQFHDECATFAYVETHAVSGTVTKQAVEKANTGAADQDFEGAPNFDPVLQDNTNTAYVFTDTMVAGQKVMLTPVDGRNLAGEEMDATTAKSNDKKTKHDDRYQFNFGQMAEGHYAVDVPANWETHVGGTIVADGKEYHHEGGDASLAVKPNTGYLYGKLWRVEGQAYFGVEGLTVSVGDATTTTDEHGRYILEGYHATGTASKAGGTGDHAYAKDDDVATVEISKDGFKTVKATVKFKKNMPVRFDARVSVPGETATITGQVTGTDGNPVAGVEIKVAGKAPANAKKGADGVKRLLTDADGNYEAQVDVSSLAQFATTTVKVTPQMPSTSKDRRTFVPRNRDALIGRDIDAASVNFQAWVNGNIVGQIVRPGGSNRGPMQGVKVTAKAADGTYADDAEAVTGTNGSFSLSVSPQLTSYTITASYEKVSEANDTLRYNFDYPGPTDNQLVPYIAEGKTVNFGTTLVQAPEGRIISAERTTNATATADSVTVIWVTGYRATIAAAGVDNVASATNVTYTLQYKKSADPNSSWTDWDPDNNSAQTGGSIAVSDADGEAKVDTAVWKPSEDDSLYFRVKHDLTVNDFDGETDFNLTPVIPGVDPKPTITAVKRGVRPATTGDNAQPKKDTVSVTFTATGNSNSTFRVAFQIGTNWVIPEQSPDFEAPVTKTGKGSKITGTWTFVIDDITESNTWDIVGEDGADVGDLTVTKARLLKEFNVRVEARQGDTDSNDAAIWPDERRSAAKTVAEKGS